MRPRAQGGQGIRRRLWIVEGQCGRAVVGNNARQRRQIALHISLEQDGIRDDDTRARQHERGGGRGDDDDRQLLPDRSVVEAAHRLYFYFSTALATFNSLALRPNPAPVAAV